MAKRYVSVVASALGLVLGLFVVDVAHAQLPREINCGDVYEGAAPACNLNTATSAEILVFWVADPSLSSAESVLPSFADAVAESLGTFYTNMSGGAYSLQARTAHRSGGAFDSAFVADSSFAYYIADARMKALNFKILQQACANGVDFSNTCGIVFIYNNSPFLLGSNLYGFGGVQIHSTQNPLAIFCGQRTIEWATTRMGAIMWYRWHQADSKSAIAFELAHEVGHVLGLIHTPGSEGSGLTYYNCGTRQYAYGHYSVMRASIPSDPNTPSFYAVGDMFPLTPMELEDQGWVTPTTVSLDQINTVIRNIRRSGQVLKIPLNATASEYLMLSQQDNTRYDAVIRRPGLVAWRVKVDNAACPIWDLESAVGRFTSGSPDPVSGLDSLDLYLSSSTPDPLKDYLGSGNDVFDGSVGKTTFSMTTNPSTMGYGGTTRTSPRDVVSNVAIKNIASMADTAIRADIVVGYGAHLQSSEFDAWPSISVDGTKVLWNRGTGAYNDVWVADYPTFANARRLLLTNDADIEPTWSSDGDTFAFACDSTGYHEIWKSSVTNGGMTRLTTTPYGALCPDWSPKGDSVAFMGMNASGLARASVVSKNGGTARLLTAAGGTYGEFGVSYSPDASKLVLSRGTSIVIMDAVGGNEQVIYSEPTVVGSRPGWSPNGDRVVFTRVEGTSRQLFSIRTDGTGLMQVTRNRGTFHDPQWHTDGLRILTSHVEPNDADDIWTYTDLTNDAPVLASVGPRSIGVSQVYTLTLSAIDVNGNPLKYDAFFKPAGSSFNPATRQFSWTPTGGQVGQHVVKFRVIDLLSVGGSPRGGSDHEYVTFTVTEGGGGGGDDDPPILQGAAAAHGGAGSSRVRRGGTYFINVFLAAGQEEMSLTVYDVRGRKVRNIANGMFTAGRHDFRWQVTDQGGRAIAPGICFIQLSAGGKNRTQKVLVLP